MTELDVLQKETVVPRGGFTFTLGDHKTAGTSRRRHAYINAWLLAITLWIRSTDLSDFADSRIEQDNVNVVVLFRLSLGAKMLEGSSFHLEMNPLMSYPRRGSVTIQRLVFNPQACADMADSCPKNDTKAMI